MAIDASHLLNSLVELGEMEFLSTEYNAMEITRIYYTIKNGILNWHEFTSLYHRIWSVHQTHNIIIANKCSLL